MRENDDDDSKLTFKTPSLQIANPRCPLFQETPDKPDIALHDF
jgi:hypothetical protein